MANLIEKQMTSLGELVEELQDEMETFETARRSPLHLDFIAHLATAVMVKAQLLHQAVNQVTIDEYQAH